MKLILVLFILFSYTDAQVDCIEMAMSLLLASGANILCLIHGSLGSTLAHRHLAATSEHSSAHEQLMQLLSELEGAFLHCL